MPHSYAETLNLTCAACGRDFEAEFWLVVDALDPLYLYFFSTFHTREADHGSF